MAKSRAGRKKQSKSTFGPKQIIIIAVVSIVIFGLLYLTRQLAGNAVAFRDIHGLSFSADGNQLIVPAHDGLRTYENGQWHVPDVPVHDYMGYSGTDAGFYSSGHPGPGSNLINPLGLVRSGDGGESIQTLAFAGETDFHLMSASYESHAVYVLNPRQNSQLSPGLHYTLDEGQTWTQSAGRGVSGNPLQLAVHPTEANTVALATEGGLFLSNDYGDSFVQIGNLVPVSAVSFDPNGERLLFGYQSLFSYTLADAQISPSETPTISNQDALGYIAINPVSEQIAIATFNKDIYLSSDSGQSWETIAEGGIGKN
ncbi:glycosyl hydrolase [Phototrophicus methaneseepsis]|uniref:Glycosyl hydrolase n=1 Tax=Phototrophicus methaneseepsis TaxID=2710758 RepID=A0A7S8EA25_9CHLR|nr:glycosyl hydrolase [Phototrophicus methaneseepsis]QPC83117.1 glycosyl hydrolase [Phototrophicus methaneseepsis]